MSASDNRKRKFRIDFLLEIRELSLVYVSPFSLGLCEQVGEQLPPLREDARAHRHIHCSYMSKLPVCAFTDLFVC